MEIVEMFNKIEEYHKVLGYSFSKEIVRERMVGLREAALGLIMEVTELIDSFPWKPWRSLESQRLNLENAYEEVIDCFFFLALICEAAELDPKMLEHVFKRKLQENYDRIKQGYNNRPEERR